MKGAADCPRCFGLGAAARLVPVFDRPPVCGQFVRERCMVRPGIDVERFTWHAHRREPGFVETVTF